MKFLTTTSLGMALALGAVTFTASSPALAKKKDEAPAAAKQNFSEAFRKTAPAVQDALAKGDMAAAQAALPAAQAAASTDDDKYTVSILQLQIALKTNDVAAQRASADAVIASGKAPPETLAQVLDMKGRLAYNAGDLAAADSAFTQLSTLRSDDDTATLLAQVKVREGRGAEALAVIDKSIAAKKAANQPVPEDWYRRALSVAYDSKPPMVDGVVKYGQELVAAYPSAAAWRTALQTYRDVGHLDPLTDLDAMRLARAAHALAGERDYYDYANSAYNKGFPGEAQAVIEEGTSANMVDGKSLASSKALAEVKAVAVPKVAADKASLPALDKSARAGADGKKALNTADAYYGYGMFTQAADLYKVALQKGGVDANMINMRLGMSLARSGDKAGAAQALGAVTGPRKALADYWLIWSNQQGGAAG